MKTLCFDAGHYKNYNQSKVFPSYYEGNKMWELCNLVKDYLVKNYEVKIISTRTVIENDMTLYNRGYCAKGCDGFYSFHSNAVNDETVDRVVIIPGFNSKNIDSYANDLGDTIKDTIGIKGKTQVYKRENNGKDYYGVLRGAESACVNNRFIIEHGFHTNYNVAKWLYDSNNLKKLAEKEGDVIAKFHKLPCRKKEIPSMIKIIKDVNYRSKADFSDSKNIVGVAKVGEVFTVVDRVKSNSSTDMYKLKSGNYITTSSNYVVEYKK